MHLVIIRQILDPTNRVWSPPGPRARAREKRPTYARSERLAPAGVLVEGAGAGSRTIFVACYCLFVMVCLCWLCCYCLFCVWVLVRLVARKPVSVASGFANLGSPVRPISLLRLSMLRSVDSKLPENPLWTSEFHPSNLRLCLSQTLWNPES